MALFARRPGETLHAYRIRMIAMLRRQLNTTKLARHAGIGHHVHPHALRHASITAALDAGVPLRDVQNMARHSDPRTTSRYDRARHNLDRHASYVVAAFIAGG